MLDFASFLLQDTASPTHSPDPQYNHKFWSGAYQTRTTTSSFAWFTHNNRYHSVNTANGPISMTTLYSACGLTNGSYWNLWKLLRKPFHYQHEIWLGEYTNIHDSQKFWRIFIELILFRQFTIHTTVCWRLLWILKP